MNERGKEGRREGGEREEREERMERGNPSRSSSPALARGANRLLLSAFAYIWHNKSNSKLVPLIAPLVVVPY